MARARPIPDLSGDDRLAAAAAKVVLMRSRELFDHAEDVLDTGDIERVHDMRVASRRLRAALETFGPCFPASQFKATLREVKELADALGERRDRDVAIEELKAFCDSVAAADRRGVESLIGAIRVEQETANDTLAPHVSPERLVALRERVSELIAGVPA
jgi:CHAD domain-containing protein